MQHKEKYLREQENQARFYVLAARKDPVALDILFEHACRRAEAARGRVPGPTLLQGLAAQHTRRQARLALQSLRQRQSA